MAEDSQLFPSEDSIAYFVKTEAFEGPLDLLLHLIKKNELDIYNIPMAEISKQYLDYIDVMRELNLDVAGEFLVMASTLIQIKSQMLLPSISLDEGEEETVEDPRAELVRRLLEYEKYREAAKELYSRNLLQRDVFKRDFFPANTEVTETNEPIEVEIFELVNAFKRILSKIPEESFHEVGSENISISDRISDILEYLTGKEYLEFEELFLGNLTREFIVATFLAILELCRLKLIRLTQIETYGTIWVKPTVLPVDSELAMEDGIDTYRA
ncbi:MAG: segregation/condensation protein A [Desulfuromonadales bacterium]|nr:segregation/condensation protein A [Desulfuromonadales bacterium]